MNNKRPVLEYCLLRATQSGQPTWGFRFTTSEGDLLMESPKTFNSRAEAERGFVSMLKAVASNQYTVEGPEYSRNRASHARDVSGRRALKRHKPVAGIPSLKSSGRRKAGAFLF
jgi:hypothetical protein